MKTFFVTISLVLSFGHTFGRNIINQPIKGKPLTGDVRDEDWNPLAELLGINYKESTKNEHLEDDLSAIFDKHNREMDKAMQAHQEMMDKAMGAHQSLFDNIFGDLKPVMSAKHDSAMAQHQGFMDRAMGGHQKEMTKFDKDWQQFDKDMNNMFKQFDNDFERMSAPFEPLGAPEAQPELTDHHFKHFEFINEPFIIEGQPPRLEKFETRNGKPVIVPAYPEPSEEKPKVTRAHKQPDPLKPQEIPVIIESKERVAFADKEDKIEEQKGEPSQEPKPEPSPQNRTGLPVFHPFENISAPVEEREEHLPAIIENIMAGYKPVIDEIEKQVQDRINSSYLMAEMAVREGKGPTVDNGTKSDDNSTTGALFSQFMDNVLNSVSQLGSLFVSGLAAEDNQTMLAVDGKVDGAEGRLDCGCPLAALDIHQDNCPMNMNSSSSEDPEQLLGLSQLTKGEEFDSKLRVAYVLHALENVLMARITRMPFEDYLQDVRNLDRLGINELELESAYEKVMEIIRNNSVEVPYKMIWTKVPWEVSDIETEHINLPDIMDNVVQVVSGRILSQVEEARLNQVRADEKLLSKEFIERQLRTEFIIKKKDDDYEWYEWVGVSLLAATSSLLLIVALFMCVQRMGKVANDETDQGVVAQNSIANENLNNKYKEKIKTIFVSLKT